MRSIELMKSAYMVKSLSSISSLSCYLISIGGDDVFDLGWFKLGARFITPQTESNSRFILV